MTRPNAMGNKRCIVTGGAHGIGAATVDLLLRRGAYVTVIDLEKPGTRSSNDRLLRLYGDVTDHDAMERCVQESALHFGAVDVVIANAGITPPPATVRTADIADFDKVLAVNFGGVLNVVRAAIDDIVDSGGHIQLVSSCAAFTPGPAGSPYMVSKAAVEQLGRSLRIELAAVGATCGIQYFGIVDTRLATDTLDYNEFGRRIGQLLPWPLNRRMTVDDAAHSLVRAVGRRAPVTVSPALWRPYYHLRGLINPLLERRLSRSDSVHTLLRDIENHAFDRRPAVRAASVRPLPRLDD
ncbi:SDR family NAD(P)-dependent oxidoreductase [Rhodococcus sp. NBC_00297]|uniref:SDR family NAD(P)-dependent oxidoreductase n=1 Tax=Rhodococcus sp. NBC_00297 TaxID=2976005 RepID=UPI002E28A933|nr:SDR family NAD(P)-dependent oxidoreductase [Rhodococcus sp. NBC_00297]